MRSNSVRLAITPYFTTSYRPARNSRRGSVERSDGIDDDRRRGMKSADQVLAHRMVDADLSADGTVDLRKKRRRHLNDWNTTEVRGRGKPGDIAGHAAANGEERARSIGVSADERIVDTANGRELFVALAVGDQDRIFVGRASQIVAVESPHGRGSTR